MSRDRQHRLLYNKREKLRLEPKHYARKSHPHVEARRDSDLDEQTALRTAIEEYFDDYDETS